MNKRLIRDTEIRCVARVTSNSSTPEVEMHVVAFPVLTFIPHSSKEYFGECVNMSLNLEDQYLLFKNDYLDIEVIRLAHFSKLDELSSELGCKIDLIELPYNICLEKGSKENENIVHLFIYFPQYKGELLKNDTIVYTGLDGCVCQTVRLETQNKKFVNLCLN